MDKVNILSFDTSGDDLKIGLSIDGKDAFCDKDCKLKHIENLLPEIELLYKSVNKDKSRTNYVSVCSGPGSFTGIRIGIAAALGLSFGGIIKCFGFSIFDVYRYLFNDKDCDVVIPVVDAKKQRFYCSFIEKGKPLDMHDLTPEEIIAKTGEFKNKKIVFAGKDFRLLKEKISFDFDYRYLYENGYTAKDITDHSKNLILNNCHLEQPKPIYLRKSEAEIELLKSKGIK